MSTEREAIGDESDADLLKGAFADEPAKEPEQASEPEKSDERTRDEHGKFKAKEEQPDKPESAKVVEAKVDPKTAEKTDDDRGNHIPAWRLREEADAKRAEKERADKLDRELAQMRQQLQQFQQHNQPKPEPIDPLENPQGWIRQHEMTVEDRLLNERFNTSQVMANRFYGKAVVDEAFKWATSSLPSHELHSIRQSLDPYGDIVERKKQADTLAEIGTDPNVFKEKYKADLMKDPEFVKAILANAKAEAISRPESNITRLPPSLNRQQSAASAKNDAGDPNDTPMSDRELLSDALHRR